MNSSNVNIDTNDGINLYCIHSSHAFSDLLCKDQPLVERIVNAAFHILTLGVPLATYRIFSCCSSRIARAQENSDIQAIGVNFVQQAKSIKSYFVLGQKALEFARRKLEEHPDISPKWYPSGKEVKNPVNPEIGLLTTLYKEVALKKLMDLIEQNKEDPWSNQEVIDAADVCMRIAFAISNLTLDELEAFTKRLLATTAEDRSYVEALTKQDSYQYRTFYYCTSLYHWLRGAITWGKGLDENDGEERAGLVFPQTPIPASHTTLFYQKGTIQNEWNSLYNEYCTRVRLYVNEKELQLADSRHFNWTQKDTGVESFYRIPDTQPT